jgi:Opacity protein and related surface antigens
MFRNVVLVGSGVLAALALTATAQARDERHSNEVHVYGGELFGDDVTDTAISGRKPELDDDVTYGIRLAYNFSDTWGIELSVGETPTSIVRLEGDHIDLDLTTFDLDAVWHLDTGSSLVPYLVAGAGYSLADLDHQIEGTAHGNAVSIDDASGFTANAGVGVSWFASEHFLVRLEARYRYMDKVLDRFDDSLNTVETTLGIGWQF